MKRYIKSDENWMFDNSRFGDDIYLVECDAPRRCMAFANKSDAWNFIKWRKRESDDNEYYVSTVAFYEGGKR